MNPRLGQTLHRKRGDSCHATVIQRGQEVMLGKNPHNHSGVLGLAEKVTFRTNLKSSAENDKTITARALVEKEILDGDPQDHLPNPVTLTRMINRLRLKQRPKEPKTLSCDISLNCIDSPENVIVADIKMEDNCSAHYICDAKWLV